MPIDGPSARIFNVSLLLLAVIFATPAVPSQATAAPSLPPALEYVDVELRYVAGKVELIGTTRGTFATPARMQRFVGRFTARLQKKGGPIDELHFDFPLLAKAETPEDTAADAKRLADRIRSGVTATTKVRLPLYPGVETVVILDGTRALLTVDLGKAPPPRAPPRP
jgi:hypothetical protein